MKTSTKQKTSSPVPQWTEARYRTFIKTLIRSGFRRYPNKFAVLKNAEVGRKINKKTGKLAMHYRCAKCRKHHVRLDMEVDHIIPIVNPAIGFTTWDDYIYAHFCAIENLQALCKPCHKKKTAKERNYGTPTN